MQLKFISEFLGIQSNGVIGIKRQRILKSKEPYLLRSRGFFGTGNPGQCLLRNFTQSRCSVTGRNISAIPFFNVSTRELCCILSSPSMQSGYIELRLSNGGPKNVALEILWINLIIKMYGT